MILRKKGWVCLWGGRCNWPSVTAVFPAERPCTVAIANNRWPVRSCNSIVLTGCRRTGLDRAPHTPVSQRYCSYRLGHFCSTIRRNRNRVRDTMGALHRCTRPVDAPRTLHPRRRRRNHAPLLLFTAEARVLQRHGNCCGHYAAARRPFLTRTRKLNNNGCRRIP